MALLVYTILRNAASTGGHIRSCSAVRFSRRLMLAICASVRTLFERLVTRCAGAFVSCIFGGGGFTASTAAAASSFGSETGGGSAVSIAVGVSAAVSPGGSTVTMPDKAPWSNVSQCSTGITLAVVNVVTCWMGNALSGGGKRDATISAGEGPARCSDTALKLTPK